MRAPVKAAKVKAEKVPPAPIDPKYLKAARELRDRYLEHVNSGGALIEPVGKYDVTRALGAPPAPQLPSSAALLPAA